MIVFDLSCEHGHAFEGWFRNSEEFSSQLASGLLTCPNCGSESITKKPSPSRINLGKQQSTQPLASNNNAEVLSSSKITEYIRTNYEDVGSGFAKQALKMHYGEIEERNIIGTATPRETTELKEEGVKIVSLTIIDKNKLN